MNSKLKFFVVFLFCLFVAGCYFFFGLNVTENNNVKIQFASWGSQSEIAILKPILADFEKEYQNIQVEFIHIPQNYFQKIHLLYASNLAPDVVFINNLYLPFYANAGVLEKLDDFSSDLTGKFYSKALKSLSYNGSLYAVPRDVSNLVVYYNKDLFNKYNVKMPNKYWTFDDFLLIAQKLTKDTNHDGKTDIWGVSFDETPPLFYLPYLMSEGGGFLSDDLKTDILGANESQKGLIFYSDLRNKYHVAPTQAESASATMAQMFLQGKLAMQVSGRWLVPKYLTDADFNWNVINFPRGDLGSVVPLDASGWAISKASKHKKEAALLVKFLSSKTSSEKFCQSGLIVPARIDVSNGKFLEETLNAKKSPIHNKVFVEVIKTSKPTPVSTDYNQLQDEITEKNKYLFNK